MERRDFMKIAAGFTATLAALTVSAKAVPLSPTPLAGEGPATAPGIARPAVTSSDQVDQIKPEEVRWGHGWHGHGGWHGRHWGWRRRHWGWPHRWGWHRNHGHRHWRRW